MTIIRIGAFCLSALSSGGLNGKRPDFETLASYEEFKKYYWYRKELSGICRKLGIEYRGTKQELNHHIEEYFCGKLAERKGVPRLSKKVSDIELHTPLLDCGFPLTLFQGVFCETDKNQAF